MGVERERMIHIGIDDTDTLDSPGTNQLARHLAAVLPRGFTCVVALRHQLLFDRRVPYTSKNGCASLLVRADPGRQADELLPILRGAMRAWYVPGSDPGLCVAEQVHEDVTTFARRAQREIVRQAEARAVASACAVHLEGFGGTDDGVIGALAGVGLLAAGDDGRVVHRAGWEWPDPFAGLQPVAAVRDRGVDDVLEAASGTPIDAGLVDVGKHLRPSYRGGRVVLYVEALGAMKPPRWRALKLP
ncbi:MAG TPA: hypothetical protein VJ803_05790 [Gemmatimonadaceae bacterium]|nr:hypothetical protein [Gemmatimonadaceae bacterium]